MNLSCPHCAAAIEFDPALAGETVRCPECQNSLRMPIPEARWTDAGGPDRSPGPADPRRVVITERTAKRWKALQAGGLLGLVAGFALLALGVWSNTTIGRVVGFLLIFAGLVVYLAGGISAWWHHG